MVYIKNIITINPPWNSFQNHGSATQTPSRPTVRITLNSVVPSPHSIWGGVPRPHITHYNFVISQIILEIFMMISEIFVFINLKKIDKKYLTK